MTFGSYESPGGQRILEAKRTARWRRRMVIMRVDNIRDTYRILYQPPAHIAATIIRQVCLAHKVSLHDIKSTRRTAPVIRARHEAMWRLRNETSLSLPAIGRIMGGRDHTTVLHAVRNFEARAGNVE